MTALPAADVARVDAWLMLCDVYMDWLDDDPDYRDGVIHDLACLPYSLDELEAILLDEVAPPLSGVIPGADRDLVRNIIVRRIEELREEPEDFPEDALLAARATALVAWATVVSEVRARRALLGGSATATNARLWHERRGNGPDLVLLHGWAMHSGVFAPLVESLASAFTLHLVDLPGHGRSRSAGISLTLADAAEAVAAVVPERALWLGWSLGGLVALHAATTSPARVRGLAMIAASPRFVRGEGWNEGMPAAIFHGFAEDLRTDYHATLDRFLMLEAQGSERMRDELKALRGEVFAHGEPAADVLCDGLDILEASDLRAALPTLAMPSLWLAGRRDRLVNPDAMRAAAAAAPRGRFHLVASGGHAPFLTEPDAVAHAIADFAATLPR